MRQARGEIEYAFARAVSFFSVLPFLYISLF